VLASLLPGLREIRAPLAAGYLWLIVGWLTFHDRVDSGASAPGAVQALKELRDAIGVGGVAAAATFLAYLLGALWEPAAGRSAELLWRVRQTVGLASGAEFGDPYGQSVTISMASWDRLEGIFARVYSDISHALRVSLGEDPTDDRRRFLVGLHDAVQSGRWRRGDALTYSSATDDWWLREASELFDVEVDETEDVREQILSFTRALNDVIAMECSSDRFRIASRSRLVNVLIEELPLLARRLAGDQEELFLEATRMKGEVEFRYALAIPIPVIVSVLSFGLGFATWLWLAATLVGVLTGFALLTDGWRRERLRNDLLVELLAVGKATSPTLDRLLERARRAAQDGSIDSDSARASLSGDQ
jgi:hypothetical protein